MSNYLFMRRPTRQDLANASCSQSCGSLGVSDPLDIAELGPRRSRDKVREQIKDYVLLMLGAPTIDIELDPQHLDAAVDLALQILEEYAPREYFRWTSIPTVAGQSVYRLPADVGYLRKVVYRDVPRQAFSAEDLGGVIPLEYMGAGGYGSVAGGINPQYPVWGKTSDWVLYKQYEDMYSRMAGQQGGWEYVGGLDYIKLYPVPTRTEYVGLHYIQKNNDWGRVHQSMQEGALAFAKIMLGRIRSKISNPPGPNGGIQLDGREILQEGLQEKEKWEERLINRFGDVLPILRG